MTCATPDTRDVSIFPRKIAAFSAPKIGKIDGADAEFRLQNDVLQFGTQQTTTRRRALFKNSIFQIHNAERARSANFAPKIAAFPAPKICKIDAANATNRLQTALRAL